MPLIKDKSKTALNRNCRNFKSSSKKWVYFNWFLFGLIIFAGLSYATTVADTGVYNSPQINNVLYVNVNSTTDIKTKIDSLNGKAGTVIIPCGRYTNFVDRISMNSNQTIKGEGDCSDVVWGNSSAGFDAVFGADNILIEGVRFDINNKSTTIPVINFVKGDHTNTVIRNSHFINSFARVIHINGTFTLITDNYLENVLNGIGIQYVNNTNPNIRAETIISRNRITNINQASESANEYGEAIDVNLHSYGSAVITDNIATGFLEDTLDVSASQVTIVGNVIIMPNSTDSRTTTGITVNNQDANVSGTISHNRLINIKNKGIRLGSPSYKADSLSVIGNTFEGSLQSSYDEGLWINNVRQATVIGNMFKDLNLSINTTDNNVGTWSNFGNSFIATRVNFTSQSKVENNFYGDLSIRNGNFTVYDPATDNNVDVSFTTKGSPTRWLRFRTTSTDARINYPLALIFGSTTLSQVTFNSAGNITIANLTGTGNAIVCTKADGTLYRGNTTGCP